MLVSEAYHPYWEHWWPHGHMIGWEDNFVHELLHLLTCIKEDTPIGPRGATFEDGYRCAEICDAIVRSHETGTASGDRLPLALMTELAGKRIVITGASQGIGQAAAIALARQGANVAFTYRQRDGGRRGDGDGDPRCRPRGDRAAAATRATPRTSRSWPPPRSTPGAGSTSG